MPSVSDLHRAVESVLATHRIGRPVFVRYALFGGGPSEGIASRLAAMAAIIRAWIGQPIQQIIVVGTPESKSPSVMLRFAAGATAFASLAVGDPSVDLTILGDHGAIYHRTAFDDLEHLPSTDSDLEQRVERGLAAEEDAP